MPSEGGNGSLLNTAKLSVIIVTYNAAETLQVCLDSIYSQKYPNIETVIIDGGSTDGTVKILEANTEKIAYWKSEPDNGIYDAMNKALKHITGSWVYFLGADDVLFDDFSDFIFELNDPNTIYYSRVVCSGIPTFAVNAYAFAKIGICHQAMVYPASVFNNLNFDTRYKISADYALNIPLFNSKDYKFQFKDHLIARFNDTGVSSTSTDEAFENDRPSLVLKHFGFKIWLRFLFWRFKKNYIKKK